MISSQYLNSYWYFSEPSYQHDINGLRLSAKAMRARLDDGVDGLLTQLNESANEGIVYLAANMLLLDNEIATLPTQCECQIYPASQSVDDQSLKRVLTTITGETFSEEPSFSLVRLSKKTISNWLSKTESVKFFLSEKSLSVSSPCEIKRLAFTTKAKTLRFFEGLTTAHIDPGLIVRHENWKDHPDQILDTALNQGWRKVIARSSSLNEDSFEKSNAGAFDSIANVPGDHRKFMRDAINATFSSFPDIHDNDEVFLQAQIEHIVSSGVCTSRVIGKNAPYYVVNYDDESGRADSVTAGDTNAVKTLLVYRNINITSLNIDARVKSLLLKAQEIEAIVSGIALDIEFIIDQNETIHIVQVRPLVGMYGEQDDAEIDKRIASARQLYLDHAVNDDGVNKGEGPNIFGVMPDANPAELIGVKPKPLAFSLYQYLITDNVVTNQRLEYGYRDVRPHRHMIKIGGSPYINVRSSFNSFTPANIDENITNKLINCYLEKLSHNISLHDKVEFEVVATTWFPGIRQWFEEHYRGMLTEDEIQKTVSGLKDIFVHAHSSIEKYTTEVNQYQAMFDRVMRSSLPLLNKAASLIDICHHYGCKPFAHLARSAFVAVSALKGFLKCGVISKTQYDSYLQSIQSVSGEMESDAYQVKIGYLDREVFYQKYGHLRPGTYDICNEAYFEDFKKYLDPVIQSAQPVEKVGFSLDSKTASDIERHFEKEGLKINFNQFDTFAREAISGREYGKFRYTRFMSHGLHLIMQWGADHGLRRNDLAFLTVSDIHGLISGTLDNTLDTIRSIIHTRQKTYYLEGKIELPDIICSEEDFGFFYKPLNKPNFITGGAIKAELVMLTSCAEVEAEKLKGKVVMIDSADPGFDWLFGCSISGLITKYGGANSHMAIRCAELNIPAAIGIGNTLYSTLMNWEQIHLDCLNECIRES